eukprot:2017622-Prorocentrum_lima.AAC.1
MTSSLVGSEMCIRDRHTGFDSPPLLREEGPWEWRRTYIRSASPQQRPSAVSYTHLTLPTICSV